MSDFNAVEELSRLSAHNQPMLRAAGWTKDAAGGPELTELGAMMLTFYRGAGSPEAQEAYRTRKRSRGEYQRLADTLEGLDLAIAGLELAIGIMDDQLEPGKGDPDRLQLMRAARLMRKAHGTMVGLRGED